MNNMNMIINEKSTANVIRVATKAFLFSGSSFIYTYSFDINVFVMNSIFYYYYYLLNK